MLRFAVAGTPHSTPAPGGSVRGIAHAASLGIRAMELEWVQMVPKNPERMREIREASVTHDVTLTVHAPYYVNLNSPEKEKLAASKRRIIDALTMAQLAGATSVCVHAAFNLGKSPTEVLERIFLATKDILTNRSRDFPDVNLAYETMGKQSQFGTLEEVLAVSREFGIYPCVDPAHMHARANGAVNSTEEWNAMFDLYEEALGRQSLQSMHMHFSGIAYGEKGEKHHLPLEESDAQWRDFLGVLGERKIGGTVVCESPTLEEDTLLMQRTYAEIRGAG